MTTAIEGLRTATRAIHERLHHHPAFAPLLATPPDIVGYRRLLGRLEGFHAPVEAWLLDAAESVLPELGDAASRRKAHLLGRDIADLDAIVAGPARGAGMIMQGNPSRAAVLGGMYVTEGATLGGRELGRRLEPSLAAMGLEGHEGRRFLLAYDPLQGAMWRGFCATLEAVAADFGMAEREEMDGTARTMFLALEEWLSRSMPPR